MKDLLGFQPGYYKITKIFGPNVLEINGTWFVKLKGISDNTDKNEIKEWLREGNSIRVVPYERNDEARIISDVWLGETHINRQFKNYKNGEYTHG